MRGWKAGGSLCRLVLAGVNCVAGKVAWLGHSARACVPACPSFNAHEGLEGKQRLVTSLCQQRDFALCDGPARKVLEGGHRWSQN